MNRADPINIIANIVVIAGWLPSLLYVVLYFLRSKWRATMVGRALMYQSVAFFLVMTVVLIGIWFPDMPGRATIRLVSYLIMVGTVWRMLVVLRRYQAEETTINHAMDIAKALERREDV